MAGGELTLDIKIDFYLEVRAIGELACLLVDLKGQLASGREDKGQGVCLAGAGRGHLTGIVKDLTEMCN